MIRGVSRLRQKRDIFHGDPFKIQSYNFRYADRPVYLMQQYPRPEPQPLYARPQKFETYYYNNKFKTNTDERRPSITTESASAFTEHRRRKFLHDFKCVPTPPRKFIAPIITCQRSASVAPQPRRMLSSNSPGTVTNSPLLRSCCNRGEYEMTRGARSATSLNKSSSTNVLRTGAGGAGATAGVTTGPVSTRSFSTMSFVKSKSGELQRKRSVCSGCEININISNLDSDTNIDNNVRIKIETDSASLRNNTNKTTPPTRSISVNRSIGNFGIDKRLSKFNMVQKGNCNQDRDRNYFQLRQQRDEEERREREQQREVALKRERERERLREIDRQRDRERLLQLEIERERDRLRILERENQRQLEFLRIGRYQEQQRREGELSLPMRALPMPSPVTMTSHLYRPETEDRLPGMMPFCERKTTPPQTPNKRAQRLRNLTSFGGVLKKPTPELDKSKPLAHATTSASNSNLPTTSANASTFAHNLERRNSGTSNGNVHVVIAAPPSNTSLRRLSVTRLNEHKPLNSHKVIGGTQHLPIHTRINNMPIRITTSQPTDKDDQFSINKVRLRNSSPLAVHEMGSSTTRLEDASSIPCNVSINVYADNLRMMRL